MSLGLGINADGEAVGLYGGGGFSTHGQEHAFPLTQLVLAPRIYRPPA